MEESNPTTPSAKVIADSYHDIRSSFTPSRIHRLTTLEVTMHRFVLAEFNTHRVFSRNSASSRAIPVEKQIRGVLDDCAIPVEFGSNQAGMQAGPPLEGVALEEARFLWEAAATKAVSSAKMLAELGVHKQVTNRLLEPFMWHRVIVTSSEWENFFNQRCSPLAQPEIRMAAEAMYEAYKNSIPRQVKEHQWHLPYIRENDIKEVGDWDSEDLVKISAARCARVSYLTHDGVRDLSEDIKLFERLATADPPHFSPMEHPATPNLANITWSGDVPLARLGNFPGWDQLRHRLQTH